MNKKEDFITWIFSGLMFVCCSQTMVAQSNEISNDRPNIIFVLTDDLGWGDVGVFFQNQRGQAPLQYTPYLDALAVSGARLTDQYANAPVCAPSRASFLLGQHQGHSNVRDNQFDKALANNYTLPRILAAAGYKSVAIGKYGLQGDNRWDENGDQWPAHPLNRGFDEFLGYIRHGDGHEHYPFEGKYRGKKEVYHNRTDISPDLAKCFTGDLWTAYAKKWIVDHQESDKKKPFFMYLSYDTPHAVLEVPTQAYPAGKGLNGGLQWLGESGKMINTASGNIDSYFHPDYINAKYDHDEDAETEMVPWPETYKRYAGLTRRIDNSVGDLVQLLKDLGIAENTLVVFTSDNGPSKEAYLPKPQVDYSPEFFQSFGPFDGIKRDCWEGGLRIPTIASMPSKINPNSVVDQPSMMSDWVVTFCDMIGISPPQSVDGHSLWPALTKGEINPESTVYVEYFNGGKTPSYPIFEADRQGVKRGQMQYIRNGSYAGVRYNIQSAEDDFEIYNVINDPKQTQNLANESEMQVLQVKFKDKVLQMRRQDPGAARPYDLAPISGIFDLSKEWQKGWVETAYDVEVDWIPRLTDLSAIRSVIVSKIKGKKGVGNLVSLKGGINIQQDGIYEFEILGTGKASLRIHEALVIDADYQGVQGRVVSNEIHLKAGKHPIHFLVKGSNGANSLPILRWKRPGSEEFEIIEKGVLIH